MWADALSWNHVSGARGNVRTDTGYSQHVLNFAFNSLFDHIPSRSESGGVLYFDVRSSARGLGSSAAQTDVHGKMRNFYKAHEFIKQYPAQRKLFYSIGISEFLFSSQVMPTIYSMS